MKTFSRKISENKVLSFEDFSYDLYTSDKFCCKTVPDEYYDFCEFIYIDYINKINETLNKSYDLTKLASELNNKFKIHKITSTVDNNIIQVYIDRNFDENDDTFQSVLNLYNCFICSSNNLDNLSYKIISIEKNKTTEVTDKVYKDNNYLYHLTRKRKQDKLLKYGLSPKSQSKISYHPERIYLLEETTNKEAVYKLKTELDHADKNKTNINDESIILKIDLSKCNKLKFYVDPHAFNGCIFTEGYIPGSAIHIVNDFSQLTFSEKIKRTIKKYF